MAVFGKKKKTVEDVAAELKKPIWWVGWAFASSVPNEIRTKTNITKIFGEEVNEQAFDTIYSESKSLLHEQKAIYEKTPTLVAHELAREIIPYLIVKKTGNKYTKKIGRAVMIAIENSLKRGEETPEAMDEERFAKDVVDHLSKHFIVKDPEKTKKDLVKVIRAIKEYSSTILSIDPIKEEPTVKAAYTHMEADPNELESSDSYLEQSAPEVFEKWWQLKTTIAEVLGTKPYRHEVKPPQKRGRKTTRKNATKKEQAPAKIITKTEPSVEEKALQALKSMGIDVKLETGNVAERKAKIFAWLEREGLVEVKEENGKPVVVPTEEFHRMVSRVGPKAAAAMIKWAAEENEPLSRALRVAKVLEALDGKLPEGKGVIRGFNLFTAGLLSLEDLSNLWGLNVEELLKSSPEAVKALLEAMDGELTVPEVPVEWLPLLERLQDNPTEEDLRKALNVATAGRMAFSALESTAIRGLPENGEEIETLLSGILRKTPELLPFPVEVPEELEEEFGELSRVLALMKDSSYIERVEGEVLPLVEKLPESTRVGLFRRESPRKRVEDFAVLLTEGNLSKEEAEERAGELKDYLKSYLSGEEAEKLVETLLLPFRAKRLRERYGSAEGFLFEYAHARASRYLLAEAYLFEALKGEREDLHDALVRVFAGMPSLGKERVSLKGVERNRRELKGLLGG